MKLILTIIIILNSVIYFNGFSQQNNPVTTKKVTIIRKNAIYLEYAGTAPMMSVNFERQLFDKKICSIYGRIGFGGDFVTLSEGNLFVPSIPFEISAAIGKQNHFVEVGIGGTPFFSKMEMWSSTPYYKDLEIDSIDYELYFLFLPRIGYRYESIGGYLLRVAYTPILYNSSDINDIYQTNFGISLGKLF